MRLFTNKKMTGKDRAGLIFLVVLAAGLAGILLLYGTDIAVLNPKGIIAEKERNLIIFASLLSLIVVLPVFALTFHIAWKYREGNTKATYTPNWDGSRKLETIWWTVPLALILVLSVVTWNSSRDLDPFKPIQASTKPLTIQVVALDWKWLFIYPEQGIAAVNFVQFPINTPVDFVITADAPMNSFWIPSLGGQIYAMSAMSTHLHLMASENGSYSGQSANISGRGFAGMKFTAKVTPQADFDQWVQTAKQAGKELSSAEYASLARPSENNPPAYYSAVAKDLYNGILMKFTLPPAGLTKGSGSELLQHTHGAYEQ